MSDPSVMLAGLRTIAVTPKVEPRLVVVMLHGYAMVPRTWPRSRIPWDRRRVSFSPKDQSTLCAFGPRLVAMDMEARARAMAVGPRDLHARTPRGRAGGAGAAATPGRCDPGGLR